MGSGGRTDDSKNAISLLERSRLVFGNDPVDEIRTKAS